MIERIKFDFKWEKRAAESACRAKVSSLSGAFCTYPGAAQYALLEKAMLEYQEVQQAKVAEDAY